MIYCGFDPSFIDINIQPLKSDNSSLLTTLPELGSHHIDTNIEFVPGGNGFNFCRTLASLSHNTTYVGPSSTFYEDLVNKLNLPISIHPIENIPVNYTAIMNLKGGEVQFNSLQGNIGPEHLTPTILDYYIETPIKPVSNLALNNSSIEWVSSLLLGLYDPENPFIYDVSTTWNKKLDQIGETNFDGLIFIDPSDISHFSRIGEFYCLLSHLKKFHGQKYLSLNEIEIRTLCAKSGKNPSLMAKDLNLPIIVHSSKEVVYYHKTTTKFKTKVLKTQKSFVGAGDVFNASVAHKLYRNYEIDQAIEYGIQAASHLIETGSYPTFDSILHKPQKE